MQNLDFKVGFGRKKDPRYMRHHTWVAVAIGGSAVIGAGVSMYGANKQAKAVQSAQDQNAQLQQQQNNSAWQGYLMSRGLNPMGATAGNIPVGAQALNTKLPLWANASVSTGPKTWRRTGGAAMPVQAPGRIVSLNSGVAPAAPAMTGGGNWWNGSGNQTYLN